MVRPSASFLVIIMFISSNMRMIYKNKITFFIHPQFHTDPRLKIWNDYLEPKVEEKDITELSLDFQTTLSAQHTEQTIIDPGNK